MEEQKEQDEDPDGESLETFRMMQLKNNLYKFVKRLALLYHSENAMAELGRLFMYEASRDWLPTVSGEIQSPIGVATIEFVEMKSNSSDHKKQPKLVNGIGQGKYTALRRRQIKIETEAWESAAKEYQELLLDMCEQKLAPNLP